MSPGDTIAASSRGPGSSPTPLVRTSTIRSPSTTSAPGTRRPSRSSRPVTEYRLWPWGDSVFICRHYPSVTILRRQPTRRPHAHAPDTRAHARAFGRRARSAAPRGARPPLGGGIGHARRPAPRLDVRRRPGVSVSRQGEDAPQRPARLRRRLRLAGPGRLLLGGAHRQPQRGRGRQVGVRPLLRAHDVPRHREVHARRLQRRHQADGRRLQRLHLRRPDRLSHPGRQAGAPQDRRDRERSLPAPHLPAARLPEGGARRPRRIQQERLQPDGEDGRDALRPRLHHAHLQAHDDGLLEGHREHAQRDGLLAAVLRPVLSPRERGPAGRRRRRSRGGLQAGRGELRRLEGGEPAPGHPRRAAPEEGAARRADLAGADAADAGRGVSHARASRRRTSTCRRWTCWPSCCSPSGRRSTRSW